jgi:hypothetical protein
VSGALANKPGNGGNAWARLSWLLGFRRLGFDVYFVEQIDRAGCSARNRDYFDRIVTEFSLRGHAALLHGEEDVSRELLEVADSAALLLNIGGHLTIDSLLRRIRLKVYLDDDPGFTQFWHAAGNPGARLGGHDFYFTFGENIGTSRCPVPTCGIDWRPVRPPVVLDEWPAVRNGDRDRFTTVASWRGPYGPVEYEGKTFGLKVHEFRRVVELPERVPYAFEIALDIHPADSRDRELLERHGWRVVDPGEAASTPRAFREYVQGSGAEFSVAQGIYVETGSGWFSDRTTRYLASGKPALVQETGFSRNLPTGEGLLAFRTLDEAVQGADRIAADYEAHSEAARAIAEEYFDSDRVLGRLLEEVGLG